MSASESPTVITTNRSGWIWTGLCALVGVASAVDCFARGWGGLGVTVLVWTAAVCWFVALVFILPRLTADAAGATVRNVLTSVRVPWGQLKDARSTMFIELIPRAGSPIRVWAAPQSAMRRGRSELRNKAQLDMRVEGDSRAKTDIPTALLVERDRSLAADPSSARTSGAVTSTFLKRDWAILGGLVVLALVSLLFI